MKNLLRTIAERVGWYDEGAGEFLLVVAMIIVLGSIPIFISWALEGGNLQRWLAGNL